ncbi:hypothetical protein HDU86_005804 [Geranomyces michiganensis]|nr:hypothetical protein HDU86_005804 [Geranomyces michiganensis]
MASPAAAPTVVLVLDEVGTPTINNTVSYTSFLHEDDNVRLVLISSLNALTAEDKAMALEYVELKSPTTNGLLEVHALRLHAQYGIHKIYTKQEDLILRASLLRDAMGLTSGLSFKTALPFRDKELMKRCASDNGFPVPPYIRIYSPASLLSFLQQHPLPVIIKPTLGSASAGIRVVKTQEELHQYLEYDYYARIDDAGHCMDYSGDILAEAFVKGQMYHVDGFAHNGLLDEVWPFLYINTNLGFTEGTAYGNVLIPPADPCYERLLDATRRILAAMPKVDDLVFHLELFDVCGEFQLCEIAARRPGGSIGTLISAAEGGALTALDTSLPQNLFPEFEFRASLGLKLRRSRNMESPKDQHPNRIIGDLLVPRKLGTLTQIPAASACTLPNTRYFPFAKVGSVYTGFSMGTMNTAARFVVQLNEGTVEGVSRTLAAAAEWFDTEVNYAPPDPVVDAGSVSAADAK